MQRSKLAVVVALAVGAATLLGQIGASARVDATSDYTKAQTYSGALRYLRVDLGFKVVEKDPDAAYILFEYRDPGPEKTTSTASVEVVDSGERVRLFVQIPKMPEYHERVLRDGLLRKLREEYGAPPPKRPDSAKPAPPPGDAGAR